MKKIGRGQKGFTMIEVIAVLVILGILSAVAVPKYLDMQKVARVKAVEGALAAAGSNATLSFSKFVLTNTLEPNKITGGDTWERAGLTQAIATDLGDFNAKYSYKNGIGEVTIKLDKTPGNCPNWMEKMKNSEVKKSFVINE